MNDVRGALALLEANATDYPSEASALFGLGRAYKTAGDVDKARIALQGALKLDPNHQRAKQMLETLH